MRIIAGAFKGRRLATPVGPGIRPTSDKLRETLFNILGARVPEARLLDGFAGTGAIGLEALSRGAAHVTMVEQSSVGLELIAENVRRCRVSDRCAIIRAPMEEAVERLAATRFDLIVLDPPYDDTQMIRVLERTGLLLAEGGWLVLEHARRDAAPQVAGDLTQRRLVTSGDSALSFYESTAVSASTGAGGPDVDA